MTKFREHRGGLYESLETTKEISSREELLDLLNSLWYEEIETITIDHYAYDNRINWDTFIVIVNGVVAGFTDGDLK